MIFNKDSLGRIDYALVICVALVVLIGILTIYSAGFDPVDKVNSGLYKRQILWFIFGLLLMTAVTILNYQVICDYGLHIYGALMVVLIITTVFGTPIRNTRAWINFFGVFSLQPSEFMKLGVVILLAKYLEIRERDIQHFRELIIPSIIVLVPMAIILRQPDFGTAMLFIPILFTMLFVGGADVSHLVAIILIAAIALLVPMVLTYREWIGAEGSNVLLDFFKDVYLLYIVSGILFVVALAAFIVHFITVKSFLRKIYLPCFVISMGLTLSVLIQNFLKDYQKKRILVFLNPDLDSQGSGYNIIQSKIAIGSGGFLGKGFLKGTQSQMGFLPEKTSDFVFAVVAEEWGFLGAVVLLVLMGLIVFKSIQIALESKDKLGALIASGIASIFFFHTLVNIGMAVGIMPVTGLPLCFVSYGGSNLLMSMIAVGILINIRSRKFVY